jgi:hypothetical protein
MKSISVGYMDAWRKKHGKVAVLYLKFSRRYYDEASDSFKYETNDDGTQKWTQLTMRDWVSIGQITWKLDVPLLNTIRASNVTLKVKNEDYQWLEGNNTSGMFKPDGFSVAKQPVDPDRGYDPFLTQWQILLGYVETGGVIEPLPIFTGVAVDYRHDTDKAYCEITVSGNEFILQSADAQLVSQTFGPEASTATGDAKVWTTVSTGISFINSTTGITVGGVAKKQGVDYTLSGLNTYNGVVTITFVIAPGATPQVNGRKWYTLQSFDSLLLLLLAQAGITTYNVSPIVFPSSALSQLFINTAAQWQACALSAHLTATAVPGSVVAGAGLTSQYTNQNFETGDLTNWTVTTTTGGSAVAQSTVAYQGGYACLLSAFTGFGSSKTRRAYLSPAGSPGTISSQVDLLSDPSVWSQYTLNIPNDGGNYQLSFEVTIDSVVGRITSTVNIKGQGGTVTFYALPVNPISTGVGNMLYVDQIYVNNGAAFQGTALTAEIDLGAAPSSWSQLDLPTVELNGGAVSWSTQGSTTSGGTYSAIVSATGNVPQSPLRRFLKIQTEFNGMIDGDGNVWNVPNVSSVRLRYFTNSIVLAMADFSGKTVFDAMSDLAKLCDYEFGFDANGIFFFRAKSVSAIPVITIGQADVITSITDFRPGYDVVINDGQVTYNDYYAEYNSGSLPDVAPTSQKRFLTQVQSESWSLLLAYDPDVASGRAQLLHDGNCRPRRRCKIIGKIMPFLDLSDVIAVNFFEFPAMAANVFGDPLQTWVMRRHGAPAFGLPQNVIARALPVKVVGITFDPENQRGEYDVQEVLS